MNHWLVQLHLHLARHRRRVIVVTLGLVTLGIWAVSHLRLSEDYTDMLPMSDPAVAGQIEALRWVRQADRLYLDVSTSGTTPGTIEPAADRLYEALRTLPELADIRYRLDDSAAADWMATLVAEAPELLTAADLELLERHLEPAAIRRRLEWFKKALSQPQGLLIKGMVTSDPVGLVELLGDRLQELRAGSAAGRLVDGRLTSPDGRHVLLSASPEFASSDHRRSERLVAAVQQAARDVERANADSSVRVAFTGAHRVAWDNAVLIREDLTRVTGTATLGVTVLMMLAFRRRWLALASLVPTAIGALAAGAWFVLSGDTVSAIALGCGSCLVGVMVDCAVHVVYHVDDTSPAHREEMAAQLARLTPSIAIAGLTTVAAFLIMLASPTAGHRQLGWFAAVGAAVSAAVSILLLPLFIPLPPNRAGGSRPAEAQPLLLTRWLDQVLRWRARSNRLAWVLTVLISVGACLGLSRFAFDTDVSRLNGVSPATRSDDGLVRGTWEKALALTTVVVTGATWDEALTRNQQVLDTLQPLQAQGAVAAVSSVARLCPPRSTRAAALARWRTFWNGPRRSALRDGLQRMGDEVGLRPDVFQAFLASLEASGAGPRGSNDPPSLLREDWLKDYWNEAPGRVALMTFVKIDSLPHVAVVAEALRGAVPGALLLNKEALGSRLAQLTERSLVTFGVLALGVNALLLWLLLGRVRLVFVALIPILAGNLWTLGALGALGHPLNFANLVFVIFVAGVSLDYCMFLLLARLDPLRGHPEREASAAASVTLCAMTTLAGVGALALARHPALFSVGITALAGISLCLLATLLLVPSLMDALLARRAVAHPDPTSESGRRRAVRRLYDYQGPYVEQFAYWKLRTDPLFHHLDHLVPARAFIVDVGCGHGLAAHWLTRNAPDRRVLGVDFDAEKIRVAAATGRENPQVTFERRDILEWSCPPCDVILLLDVLHYLPAALRPRLLSNLSAALRPGGRLVLREAARSDRRGHVLVTWSERWAVWSGHNRTAHGLHFATAEEYQALLSAAGFGAVETRDAGGLGSNFLWVARKDAEVGPGSGAGTEACLALPATAPPRSSADPRRSVL